MFKYLLLFCIAFLLCSNVNNISAKRKKKYKVKNTDSVYLCLGSLSYTYHLYDTCSGYKNCLSNTTKTTLNDAVNFHNRKLCKNCLKGKK